MDRNLEPFDDQPLAEVSAASHCGYCGAKLVAFYYFCTTCGTPYKPVEQVLPAQIAKPLTTEQRIERKAPHARPLAFAYSGVVLIGGVFAMLLYQLDLAIPAMILQMSALLIVTGIFGAIHAKSLLVQLTNIGFHHWAAWAGLGLLVPALAVNFGFFSGMEWLIERLTDEELTSYTEDMREQGINMFWSIMLICVYPALAEEIGFRGLLQHWLQVAVGPKKAIIYASFFFALVHLNPIGLPYLFALGALFGWVKWKTGSLWPSIVLHFLHNLVVIAVFE